MRSQSSDVGQLPTLFISQERRDVEVVVAELLAGADFDEDDPRPHRGSSSGRPAIAAAGRIRQLRSNPVATTVTRTSSPIASSMTAPKMMLALESAALDTISAASLTSNRPRSGPPVMLSRMPVAPSTLASSSGLRDRALGCLGGAVLGACRADAHQRRAGVAHDRAHVREVEVDQARHRDQVGDALHALAQHVVGDAERVDDRGVLADDLQQLVVRDHDERVDLVLEHLGAGLGALHALVALEHERAS